MDKVATDIRETLSKTEQGDAIANKTPLAPLQTMKPEHKETAPAHSNILDSLLQAISPKPAEAAKPAPAPVIDNPGPGVAPKSAKAAMAEAPVAETDPSLAHEENRPSLELLKEKANSAVKELADAARSEGQDFSSLLKEIADFAKEQTGEMVGVPSTPELAQLEKEKNINSIDEEAMKGEQGLEGFHAQEKKNMEGLLNISARISTLGVTAGENPFAKKDDEKDEKPSDEKKEDNGDKKPAPFEKKEDKEKDDKKPAPFEKKEKSEPKSEEKKDKKEEKPAGEKEEKPEHKPEHKAEPKSEEHEEPKKSKSEKKEEKNDLKELKEALKIMEKFLSKEEKHGDEGGEVEIAKEVVEGIKELTNDESKEKGMGEGLDLGMGLGEPTGLVMEGPEAPIEKAGEEPADMFGEPKNDLAKEELDTMKPGAPMPGEMKPVPTIKPNLVLAKFNEGDRVLLREAEANEEDPGKIVAVCANNKYVVDWGTEIPTEEDGKMLIKIETGPAVAGLFGNAPAQEIAAVQGEGNQMAAFANEETKVLSGMSFADAMTRMSEDYDDNCDVMHIGSGLKGKIVSKAENRLVIDFGGKEGEFWPHEVKLFSSDL